MNILKYYLTLLLVATFLQAISQGPASITEKRQNLKTYPFSDPNPIPNPDNSYYPYFRFDGFAKDGADKEWNVVELENDYIKVSIFPEIGGKIWGAVEKSTGHEFIYYNSVVKYRDIAMRGAWTSGGIELNFGIIGHAPTSATPVDYSIVAHQDGSVSCFLSATDLLTRTRWEAEVKLEKDKAYFTTNTRWHNPTPIVQPYYQWMNAAYQVKGDLEFCFPGSHWIGHDGGAHPWPMDPEGRDRSWYKNNSFGGSKSNHVLGGISDHYAGYWHDLEFGSGHYSPYGEKLGMKVFQWAHSRSGGIWEDLLTDTDGQYVELQSGRLFNQAVPGSTKTPFKHHGFEPYATDIFVEYWFPVLKTKGVKKANQYGVLNVENVGDGKMIYFCPLQKTDRKISIYKGETLLTQFDLELDVLETWSQQIDSSGPLKIVLGNNVLTYSEKVEDNITNRPMEAPADFDWESSYGKYLDGQQWIYQKRYELAQASFEACIEKNPYFAPALNQLAVLQYRKAAYDKALQYARTSISINAYDAEANFVYGLVNRKLGKRLDARDGFSVALLTPSWRIAAEIELSKLALLEGNVGEAEVYANNVLANAVTNLDANKLMAVISRKKGSADKAAEYLDIIQSQTRLDHFVGFEKQLLKNGGKVTATFLGQVQSELPHEILMELALWYKDIGCPDESIQILELTPGNPMSQFHLAYLFKQTGNMNKSSASLQKAVDLDPDHVSPFRPEGREVLAWAAGKSNDWKPRYYLGLLDWSLGHKDKAMQGFVQAGDLPDHAHFYMAKSQLLQSEGSYDAEKDLLKALSLAPEQWRIYAKLQDFYLSKNRTEEALAMAEKSTQQFPDNNVLKYNYAKCLMADGKYSACKKVLATTVILPSEGARYGRVTYQQSCVMEALDYYKAGKYSKAVQSIGSARLWPENLGVGKPFTVDERIENYFEAMCFLKKGKKKQAGQLFQKVVDYNHEVSPPHSSVDYMYLMSLRQLGINSEVDSYLDSWEDAKEGDPLMKWCRAMLAGDQDEARKIADTINTESGGTPWDPAFADPEFEIVKAIADLR